MEKTIIAHCKYTKDLIMDVLGNIYDGLGASETINIYQDQGQNINTLITINDNSKGVNIASIYLFPIEDLKTSILFLGYSPKQVLEDKDRWVFHTIMDFAIEYINVPGAYFNIISTPITTGKIEGIKKFQVYQVIDEVKIYFISELIYSRLEEHFKEAPPYIPPWESIEKRGNNRKVLQLYWSGYTKVEISRMLNITERHVYRILAAIDKKLLPENSDQLNLRSKGPKWADISLPLPKLKNRRKKRKKP